MTNDRTAHHTARLRRVAMAVGITVLLTGAGVGVAAVRADRAAADDRTATAAASARTAADLLTVTRAEADLLTAARREHARVAEVAVRTAAGADLTARIAVAEPVLAASERKVADDAVRQALAAALDAARATLAAAQPAAPVPDLAAAGTAVDAACTAVEAAQVQWQAAAGTAASSRAERAAAPSSPSAPASGVPVWVTSVPTADGDGSNGHMPASAMCLIPWGTDQIGSPQYLRCDATDALTRLNDAFRAHFGESIAMDLTYRSYDEQVAIRAYYGARAARPGTSNHGLGLALDVQEWPDVYGFGTPRYEWLVANGPAFGWVAPASVRQGAAYPEYWHYEYRP